MILALLVFTPLVAAVAIAFGSPARKTALAAAVLALALTIGAVGTYDSGKAGFQHVLSVPILPALDLKFLLGADGLSLTLLLLTSLVTVAAISVAPAVDHRERTYYASLLLLAAAAFGAFASQDLFFFYAFHELALIPTFLLIGIWGFGDRQAAAWKVTIYLALGSFVLLIGLIGLYQSLPAGARTFDMIKLQSASVPGDAQGWIFLTLLIGFGVLVSLFPFHTWAPQAYAAAPTPAAMLHAGVLKKFGLYGLLRLAVPLLPEGMDRWTNLLLILLAGNILYVGLVTIAQKRLDLMLGYSSVMHMGYIFLGLASLNVTGLTGAALLMFAHGLSIAALFAINGEVRRRADTVIFSNLGGLAKPLPFLGLAFGLAAFASIGLPGFANFASELLVFFGGFEGNRSSSHFRLTTGIALWGVVISAIYMLRGYRATFFGPTRASAAPDATIGSSLRWPLVMLLAVLLVSGFYPQYLIQLIGSSLRPLFAF
jgi:NADH-quinone oxidoreductase subunit M